MVGVLLVEVPVEVALLLVEELGILVGVAVEVKSPPVELPRILPVGADLVEGKEVVGVLLVEVPVEVVLPLVEEVGILVGVPVEVALLEVVGVLVGVPAQAALILGLLR